MYVLHSIVSPKALYANAGRPRNVPAHPVGQARVSLINLVGLPDAKAESRLQINGTLTSHLEEASNLRRYCDGYHVANSNTAQW